MNNYVKKSGDTMSGDLKLSKNCKVIITNNDLDITTNPTSTQKFYPIVILETKKYNDFLAYMRYFYETDGSSTTSLISVCETTDGKRNAKGLDIHSKKDGTGYVVCPKSNVNSSIVTTVSHGTNYVRFGNGIQICWFYPQISGSGKSNQTLTLPVAFNNTNYLALVQQTGDSPTNDYTNTLSIMNKTTTNFVIRKAMGESMYLQVLCVGYWY